MSSWPSTALANSTEKPADRDAARQCDPDRDRITAELPDYLRNGVSAGMQLPDAADPALDPIRVVSRH
jgi:hypothetical protein